MVKKATPTWHWHYHGDDIRFNEMKHQRAKSLQNVLIIRKTAVCI